MREAGADPAPDTHHCGDDGSDLVEIEMAVAYDDLIFSIYQESAEASPWIDALERLRGSLQANVACLRIAESNSTAPQQLYAAGPLVSPQALHDWENHHPRDLLPFDLKIGEVENLDWRETPSSRSIGTLLNDYDIAHMIVTCVDVLDGAQVTLNCARGRGEEPFSRLDKSFLRHIGMHFRKAMRIRRELTHARIVGGFQTDALDNLGIAAILLTPSRKTYLLNRTAQFALDHQIGLRVLAMGLHATEEADDPTFQKALREALQPNIPFESKALRIGRGENGGRLNVIVRRRTHPSFLTGDPEHSVLIFVRVHEPVGRGDVKMLQQLFGFTNTESQLAIGLAKGMCLKDIEAELNILHNTARAHLRSMFLKAEVSRQSQLVSLITSSLVPLGRDMRNKLQ
jgi:DNA-binding CsgD family transcriptional regulator